jgi:hypothetical protein
VRQVNLGADLISTSTSVPRLFSGSRLGVGHKVLPDFLRLINFDGTGMGLLFSDADGGKQIQDFLALDFQLSGEVVNSNLLLHPPCISPKFPLGLHSQPHRFSGFGCAPPTGGAG